MSKSVMTPTDPMFGDPGKPSIFDTFEYSGAVKAGGLIFVAGQVGLNDDGSIPPDAATQIDNAFRRLAAILTEAGASMGDLVELVSYHVRIGEQLAAFREIKSRHVPAPYPTWTILEVAGLARPDLVIEIKAVAVDPAA